MQTAIKLFISIGILALLVLHMDQEALKSAMKDAFDGVHASAWVYAFAFIIAQLLLISLRWMLLINIGRYRMTYIDSVQITVASLIANMLFITTISGIAVRIAVAYKYGASLFKSIFATAMDRFMTLFALVALSAIFFPSLGKFIDNTIVDQFGWFIAIFMCAAFVFMPLFLRAVIYNLPKTLSDNGKIRSGIRYLKLLFNDKKTIIQVTIVSLLAQICFFAAVYAVAISSGVSLSFLQVMVVLPAIALISSIPFSFGGWGIREGAFVYGLGLLAVPMETAFSISIQIGLVSMLATIFSGIPTLLNNHDAMFAKKAKQNV